MQGNWFLTILRDFLCSKKLAQLIIPVLVHCPAKESLYICFQTVLNETFLNSIAGLFNIFVCITQQKYNLTMFLASDSVSVMFVNLDHLSFTYVCICITVFKLFAWKYPYWNIYCLFWWTVTEYFLVPVTFLTSIELPDLTDSLLRGW